MKVFQKVLVQTFRNVKKHYTANTYYFGIWNDN